MKCNIKWFHHTFVVICMLIAFLLYDILMMVTGVTKTFWLIIVLLIEHIYKCAFVGLSHKYKIFFNTWMWNTQSSTWLVKRIYISCLNWAHFVGLTIMTMMVMMMMMMMTVAQGYYTHHHHQVANIVHQKLAIKYGFSKGPPTPYYKNEPQSVF